MKHPFVRHGLRVLDEGMHYVDTRAAFRGTTPGDFWAHGLDPHPNGAAHAIFADVLGEYLEDSGLLSQRSDPDLEHPPRK